MAICAYLHIWFPPFFAISCIIHVANFSEKKSSHISLLWRDLVITISAHAKKNSCFFRNRCLWLFLANIFAKNNDFSPAEFCPHISPVDLESVIKNSIVFVNFRAMNVILNCVSLSPPKANTKQKQHAHVTNKYCQSASKCDFSIFLEILSKNQY